MQTPAVNWEVRRNMLNATNRLFCRLDGLTPTLREERRVASLEDLGLLEAGTIPVFEEAIQTAACHLEMPISILGLMVREQVWLKSALGLSRLGLMNPLASSRKIPRQEAFCTYVVDSQQALTIEDASREPVFADSLLVQLYGIRAYLGVPLMTSDSQCLGTLAVMDLVPRQFTPRDVEWLTLIARWCSSEFEREHLLRTQTSSIYKLQLQWLRQISQKLRNPLTAIIGMSSVLRDRVFGSLSVKQQEYLDIIHSSGQQMNWLVEEILKFGIPDEQAGQLELNPVNVEMLCQEALNSLSELAKPKRQELRLSLEPEKSIWLLDKERVRQALYYLAISAMESNEAGSQIDLHLSYQTATLEMTISPLRLQGEGSRLGLTLQTLSAASSAASNGSTAIPANERETSNPQREEWVLAASSLQAAIEASQAKSPPQPPQNLQALLGLLLGCHMAESHGGKIKLRGSPEAGYRYVLTLPKIATLENPDRSS